MNTNNKVKNLTQARTAITVLLKKYGLTWPDLTQNNTLLAWQALGGLWRGKRIPDPVAWQKKIRREWDRNILQ